MHHVQGVEGAAGRGLRARVFAAVLPAAAAAVLILGTLAATAGAAAAPDPPSKLADGDPLAAAATTTGTVALPESEDARKAVLSLPRADMEKLAKGDPLEFMRQSLKWTDQQIQEYTCQFKKIENIEGKLRKPELISMKFRATKFSVYLKWVQDPSKGQEAIYVDGANSGKVWVHPSGVLGVLFRKVSVDPTSKDALKHSRRPVTSAGMANMLRVVIPQCEEAKTNGDLKLTYEGLRDVGGRPTYVFRRVLPQKGDYPCDVCLIYIDAQYFCCVRTDAYDWNGDLISHYSYVDLQVNPGLKDTDFSPDNGDYGFRLF
jgi:hypothetical protein